MSVRLFPRIRRKPVRILAVLLVALAALSACSSGGSASTPSPVAAASDASGDPTQPHTVTVTDELGRQVEITVPVTSVVVGYNWYNIELLRGIGVADRVVGVSAEGVSDTPGNAPYWASVPGVSTIVSKNAEFNYDAITAANPDLFITLSNSPYQEATEKLAPFGIPVLVVTAWDPKLFVQNVNLLGQIFGTEDRAKELSDFYTEITSLLSTRLAGLTDADRPSVYFENGQPFLTGVPGSGWNDMILQAGGKNLFGDIDFAAEGRQGTVHQTPVDPADVLARDPDFILRHGIDGYTAGYEPFPTTAVQGLAAELLARPGWADLNAVKNGNVFIANNFFTSALAKELGALFLAKYLHPDTFTDVDLDAYFRRWVEDFQQTPYTHGVADYVYRTGDSQ